MFDGAAVAGAVTLRPEPAAHAGPAVHGDATHAAAHRPAAVWADGVTPYARLADHEPAGGTPSRNVLFVDARVRDAAALLAHARAGTEVVYLQGDDGLAQMRGYLDAHPGADSVQILAHGHDGDLWLGNTYLSAANLRTHVAEIQRMGADLKPGGNIQIYVSDTGAPGKGLAYVGPLAELTERDAAPTSTHVQAGHGDLKFSGETLARVTGPQPRALDGSRDTAAQATDKQVVFINSNVADLRSLVAGLPAGGQYVLLDSTKNGLLQIEQYLQAHPGVSAIHLVSHGATGEFQVGSTWINEADFSAYSADFVQIGGAMKAGGDFLIYGCNVAESADGKALVQQIASISGLNVAASTDATGAAALGGDWSLEYDAGAVHTSVVFSHAAEQQYGALLAVTNETYDSQIGYDTPGGAAGVTSFTLDGMTYALDQAAEFAVDSTTVNQFGPPPLSTGPGDGVLFGNVQGTSLNSMTMTLADGHNMAVQSFDIDINLPSRVAVEALNGAGTVVGTLTLDTATSGNSVFHVDVSGNSAFAGIKSLRIREVDSAFLTPTLNNFTYVDLSSPPVVTASGGSTSFVEADNATSTRVAVDSGFTLTDGDANTAKQGTVRITGNFSSGQDVLAFSNTSSSVYGDISATYSSGSGVLTLTSASGTATIAQWQSAFRAVTYTDTAVSPSTATRTVSFTLTTDAYYSSSNTTTKNVTVTATDQTPIVTTSGGTTTYSDGAAAVRIDSAITVSDSDNTTQSSGTVSVSGGFHSGDSLGFTNDGATMGNIAGSYNAATGVLTLTSAGATATDAQWADALKAVTFSSTSTTYGSRTISFATSDGTKTSAAATDTINVVNPLRLTVDSGAASFVSGDNAPSAPVVVDPGLTVSDTATGMLSSATVTISGNFTSGEDFLQFTNDGSTMGNITAGSFNQITGALTLTSAGSTATLAQWRSALDSIKYTDVAVTPNALTRTVSFSAVDSAGNTSSTVTRDVTVTVTDQTPIVTATGGTTSYVGASSAVRIDGGISVSDLDNTTQSSGTVSVSAGFHSGDTLSFTNDGSTMGNITASYNAATGVLTLTSAGATADTAQWAAALKAVTFSSTSTTYGSRTISFATSDGTKTSAAATDTVNMTAPPVITTDSGSAAFVAGDNATSTPVAIDSGLTVTDGSATTLGSTTVAITGGFHSGQDVLAFANDGSTMGNITASYNSATGVMTLTSSGATATLAQWQSALRSVTYTDSLVTPNNATRTISFSAVDGAGNTSATATRTVTVTDTDQTPILTTTGGTTNYVGASPGVTIDGHVTVSDLDNSTQTSATVAVGTGFQSGDVLSFTNDGTTMGNIQASYSAGTGVLLLTSIGGTATNAQWASALSSVTFSSTSTSYGIRTILFQVNDGTKNSTQVTDTVSMTAPPVITTDAGSAAFVAGDNATSTPVAIDSGLTVTDGSAVTFGSTTVAITGGFVSGQDVLSFTNDGATMGNITASYNAVTGVMTLTSSGSTATLAQWQSALRSVTYTDTAVTPNNATRTISFSAVDGAGNTSTTATRTVTVTDTDQTPIVTTTGGTTNYVGGASAATIDGGISVSDLDNTTQSSGTASITGGFHSGDVLTFANSNSTTFGNILGSYNSATGVLTLTSPGATATDAQWSHALSAVTFSAGSSATPGNRTISFATSDGTKTSAVATDTVSVLGPPTIATDSGSAAFVAGDNAASTPVAIDSGLTLSDGAAPTLSTATVAITGNFHSGEDVLAFTNTSAATYGNIAASYNAATGVLTLTSSGNAATLAQWQAALDAVTYTDTAVTPSTATRTISFAAVDAAAVTSNTATRTVTVTDTDQTPIVTVTGGTTNYVAGAPATMIDGGISVTDLDNTTQSSGTVSIAGGFHSGDTLTFVNTSSATFGNIVGSYNAATGVLTLTSAGATATDAQWSDALSAVAFSSTSTSYGNRTIAFATSDGTKTSAVATDTVDLLGLPKVTNVSSTTPDGSYKAGDTIYLTVSFDQTVTVDTSGGSPMLQMETGGVDHDAVYVSGSGGTTLTFAYVVQAGDVNADLDYASTAALSLDGGNIRSAQGIDAALTLPATGSGASIAGQHAIVVDGVAPAVVSVGAPANGTYVAGQALDFTVNYSEAVTVDTSGGTPRIAVTLATGGTVYADYVSGSGTTALLFRYTVADGQADPDGITLAGAIQVNGGGIHDAVGNAEVDTLHGVASTAGVRVDALAPTASIVVADTALKAGETSQVTITFSEAVHGLTIDDFTVANGSLSGLVSSDGGLTWAATFTPAADVTAASNAITLDLTRVADAAGNAGRGATASNTYAVDTRAPQVAAIDRTDASPSTGRQGLDYTVTFDEDVSGVDASDFTLATTGNAHAVVAGVTRVGGHTYTVHLGSVSGTGNLQLGLVADGSGITDTAGNALTAGAQGPAYVVGGVSPTVLPPVTPMPTTNAPAHDQAVSVLTTVSPVDLPTIYYGDAAPPRSIDQSLSAGGALRDGLAILATRPQAMPDSAQWAELDWQGLLPIEANTAFSVPLPGLNILQVSAVDGRPLPPWLVFDPVAGTLAGTPPRDFDGTLALVLIVRDSHGQVHDVPLQLSATKTVQVSHDARPAAAAKPALALQFGIHRHGGDHAALLRQLAIAQRHAASAKTHP
ncbi:DUF4347 domain-containing protein [Frateuria terrea]|nr:DUF4347 domain-containing protein [Frateuria terrea]